MSPDPIIIDEREFRPEWDVWLVIDGTRYRTRPCWEVEVGEAFTGPRGLTRVPRLLWRRARTLLFGVRREDYIRVKREDFKQTLYPSDRRVVDGLSSSELWNLSRAYATAEAEWHHEHDRRVRDGLIGRFSNRERPEPRQRGGGKVFTPQNSQQLADRMAGMPGVVDLRPREGND